MASILTPSRAIPHPELFVPTWLFDEETILAALAGLDDEMLMSIHLGRFCVGLQERMLESAEIA
jgi:hypothetical protein